MSMIPNEKPRLVMKKVIVNALLLVTFSAAFIFITSLMDGRAIGYPSLIIMIVLLAALVFDVVIFAAKNPTRQVTVRYSDPRTEERLNAILEVLGYRLSESKGDTRLYKPSFWIGGMNGKVTMRYSANRVVITGPLFAIGRVEERLWLFSYADITWFQSDGRPEPHYAEAGFDYSHVEPIAPFGSNTGYEPVGGTSAGSGR